MSTMTDLYRGKQQRFSVTFKGERRHANATGFDGALAQVRTTLIREAVAKREVPDAALATMESFAKAATAKTSLRY